jgi:hypothetical protein
MQGPSFGVAFALQKENGGSEGELNRRLGAQESPSIGSLASHVFSVDADGDIARQLHWQSFGGGLCSSGSDSLNIVGNVCFRGGPVSLHEHSTGRRLTTLDKQSP